MFKFPENLYTDVRIENVYETKIAYTLDNLDQCKTRKYKAAFIRIFDGQRWYYSSTSETRNIQGEIDSLAKLTVPNPKIYEHPTVKKLEVNTGVYEKFNEEDVSKISKEEKLTLLDPYFELVKRPLIKITNLNYIDEKRVKEIYSSKGTNLTFDTQRAGISINFNMVKGDKHLSEAYQAASCYYKDLLNGENECKNYIKTCEAFIENSKPVDKGKYTVILSPKVAGVFAHESFGHKSEADFMVGDEAMKKEWAIGSKVGSEILSIVDDGNEITSGFAPFDDEGTKARKTYLIKDGILAGRLHSGFTAGELEEEVTGNGRAINFEFEPIVRMTSTYILPGDKTMDELISEVKDGILIENFNHGSGMSTFTIAPRRSYMIKDGKITDPVNVSVITGTVFEALNSIDGLSNKLELVSMITGGCGKMEQYPLPVAFGGPYVRVKNMNVQ
jgi:TldD protein